MAKRLVQEVFHGRESVDGAGVKLTRCFGVMEARQFDPFLMFDDFSSEHREDHAAGFPFHPHRGIETVTYLLEGSASHRDSLKNAGMLQPGDVQWMTAGSGIIHEEMPGDEDRLTGFQLWVNLPREHKMTAPRYQNINASEIPTVTSAHATVRVIAGEFQATKGPVSDIFAHPTYLDIELDAHAHVDISVPQGDTAFCYIIRGELTVDESGSATYGNRTVVLFERVGDSVELRAGNTATRLLFMSGTPLNEPIAWGGPIVMNTEAELQTAFEELRNGTFTKQHT